MQGGRSESGTETPKHNTEDNVFEHIKYAK